MAKSSKDQIEQDEKRLLSELTKTSKEDIEQITKNCGFSRQKIWRIIKQLEEKGVIWGHTTIFNEKKLGLIHFVLLIKKSIDPVDEKDLDVIISRKTEDLAVEFGITIESSAYIHGEYDWLMTFTAKDIKEAKNFSNKLVILYPNLIEKMTILQSLFFVKKHHILNPEREMLKGFL